MNNGTPTPVSINAWVAPDQASTGNVSDRAGGWSMRGKFPAPAGLLGPEVAVPESQWDHPQHGWGMVLPERADGWSNEDKAWARDAPPSVQTLVRKRLPAEHGPAPVFRYDPRLPAFLRRYFPDGTVSEPRFGETFGLHGTRAVPRYLLIVASPEEVPWRLQYALNQNHLVGRLDLDETGLGNYVEALLSDWRGATADPQQATVWSVDLGAGDITREMRATVAHPVYELLQGDDEINEGVEYLSDDEAIAEELRASLSRHPALIVTTSHGKTSPLGAGQEAAMSKGLGVPVDRDDASVDSSYLEDWSPDGAIWYSHACCSAGAGGGTSYDGLLTEGTLAHQIVHAVARLAPQVSPLPKALLGRPSPLRAFVGHVEPTFDWTLRDELTREPLTEGIRQGLYRKMFQPWPVALAFDQYHRSVGQLYRQWTELKDRVNDGNDTVLHDATRIKLTAIDRESLVILGDPTVTLPPLPSKRG